MLDISRLFKKLVVSANYASKKNLKIIMIDSATLHVIKCKLKSRCTGLV